MIVTRERILEWLKTLEDADRAMQLAARHGPADLYMHLSEKASGLHAMRQQLLQAAVRPVELQECEA